MNTIISVAAQAKAFEVTWHAHESWELVYCTAGQGAFRFRDGQTIPYHMGELVAIPPNTAHANSSHEGFANIRLNLLDPTFPYREPFKIPDENSLLLQAMQAARINFASDRLKRAPVLAALGDLIAGYLVVLHTKPHFSAPVEKIRQEILNNHTRPDFALDQFIHAMPFHYDYLRKIFKKEIGMSPLEYLTSLRMKNAERLLSTTWSHGLAVAEVAQMCGYENALYFSRVFKKHHGCSPSQFACRRRKNHAADPGRTEIGEPE